MDQYQLLPDLTDEEFVALKADIAARGVMVPVERDEQGAVLDGHHRVRACEELGIADYPTIIRPGLTEEEKTEHILALNLDRRHLSREQRQELVARLRGEGWSLRHIGERLHVDPMTVHNDLATVENSTVEFPDRIMGKDGKSRPAHRPAVIATTKALFSQALDLLGKVDAPEGLATVGQLRAVVRQEALAGKREAVEAQARGQGLEANVTCQDGIEWLASVGYCADLLITDPPYSTDIEDIGAFAASWLPSALSCVKDTGRAYIFVGAYPEELLAYLAVGLADDRMVLQQVLPWTYRNTLGPAPTYDYKQNWQAILYFVGPLPSPLDCPLMTEQFSVQDVNAPDGRLGDRYHAWQKPDELAERLVRHSTKPGDVVIDPFCGTGTFLLAAGRLGRKAWGCDHDDAMLEIALERGCHRYE